MNDCLNRMCSILNAQDLHTRYIRYRYTPHSFARLVQYVFKTTVTLIDENADSLLDKHMELLYSEPKFLFQPLLNIDLLTWFKLLRFNMSRWRELCSENHKPYLNGITPIVRLCMVVPCGIVSENMPWNAVLDMNLEAQQWYCDNQNTPHVAWIKQLKENSSIPNDKWYLCCKHFTLIEASPNDPEAELLVSTPVCSRALAFASLSQTTFTLRLSQEACSVMQIKEWAPKLGEMFTIYECKLAETDRVSIAYGVPQRSSSVPLLSNISKADSEKICEIKTIITTNGVTSLKENLKAEQTVHLQYHRAECKADGSIVYFSGKIIFTDKSHHLELLRRGAIVKPQPCLYSNAFILEFQLLEEANESPISLCVVCPYPVDVSSLSLKIARKSAYIEYTICLLNETNTCKASTSMRLFSNTFNSLPLAAFPRIDVNSLPIISNQSLEIRQVIKDFVALQRSSNQNMESLPFIEVLKT